MQSKCLKKCLHLEPSQCLYIFPVSWSGRSESQEDNSTVSVSTFISPISDRCRCCQVLVIILIDGIKQGFIETLRNTNMLVIVMSFIALFFD